MFTNEFVCFRDTGSAVEIVIGEATARLDYREVMQLSASLEAWLQRSADDNVGVWAFSVTAPKVGAA